MSENALRGKFEINAHVLEYSATPSISILNSPNIDMEAIIADDPNPMFVILEICRTTVSVNNDGSLNRRYKKSNMVELANLTPGVQGFLGHPDPMKVGFEFREPHSLYVGAIVEQLQDGITRCLGKTYLFKTSPLREWIPKSIAAGKPMTVSINATGDVMRLPDNTLEVLAITGLESIDWANPGTEGISTSKSMVIVSEMKNDDDNNQNGGNIMERNDLIKGVTLAEFRAYNPDAVNSVIKGLSIAELQTSNPELLKTIQESGKITEMQLTVDGTAKVIKLSDVQSVLDTHVTKISELQGQIDSNKLTEYKAKKIAELVPETLREQMSKRVIGTTEKQIDDSITSEMAYIQELQKTTTIPGGAVRVDTASMADTFKAMFNRRETPVK